MSNNTHILITGSFNDTEIEKFNKLSNLNFSSLDLDSISIGNKFANFDVWCFDNRCIPREQLLFFIKQFNNYNFGHYSSVVMTVSCNNNDDLDGIYIHPSSRDELKNFQLLED